VLFDKTASLFEKHINILAPETASPGNWHCANRRTFVPYYYCKTAAA